MVLEWALVILVIDLHFRQICVIVVTGMRSESSLATSNAAMTTMNKRTEDVDPAAIAIL